MIEFTPENKPGRRILFTPGPLTTTRAVRDAMRIDLGSWDLDCIELVRQIRTKLVELAQSKQDLTCTLLQGSGTYAVEAMIGAAIPRDGKLLVLSNGAYGRRMAGIAQILSIPHRVHTDPETQPHNPDTLDGILRGDPSITHVGCVHCETTTGLLNPVREIGLVAQRHGRRYLLDAISSFAGYPSGPGEPIDFDAGPIDHMAGSANKCIEGVPGFAFVISRREAMERAAGNARSVVLDLYDQWSGFEKHGKFRFTPPTHVLLAFRQALAELDREGGVPARANRYRENHRTLVEGMARLGYRAMIAPGHQSHVITTFLHPNEHFDFQAFYDHLRGRGFIIYPGKMTDEATFRIGSIGSIAREEIQALLGAIEELARPSVGRDSHRLSQRIQLD